MSFINVKLNRNKYLDGAKLQLINWIMFSDLNKLKSVTNDFRVQKLDKKSW
jgi:hypothetical protein